MAVQFTQGHALVIGVGGDLPGTVDDAVGLANMLRDSGRCAYPSEQVHLLTGVNASRTPILERFNHLAQTSDDEATVLVYFSGHGYEVTASTGKSYYLMAHGYDVNRLFETAVSGVDLADALLAIPHRKLLLLLDCCHAGGLDNVKAPGLTLTKSPLPAEAQNRLAQGSGRVVIASSRADELSFAGNPYSAFTLALLEVLSGEGVAQKDGYVRVADLALHTREKVPQRTGGRQHPILNFEQADNFTIAYYAGGDTESKGLPFDSEPVIEAEPGSLAQPRGQQADAREYSTIVQGDGDVVATGGSIAVGRDVGGNVSLGGSGKESV